MNEVVISAALSLDGFLDDDAPERLVLSSEEDFAEVRMLRAAFDAILVGAETIRRDDPSLRASGRQPRRVTITRSGAVPREARFFGSGGPRSVVLAPRDVADEIRTRLGDIADVVALERDDAFGIVAALEPLGIGSLFVEGGARVLTSFLSAGLFTRLRLSIAPFFLGSRGRAHFVEPAIFRHDKDRRLHLLGVRTLGNCAVLDLENTDVALH
ncbi:MAG: RibD family protein [Candidatus Baltobacteraceae bacterium]